MKISKIPSAVGRYRIGKDDSSVGFYFEHKPFIIHRFFMRVCLGFRWEDLEDWHDY